jgi:hypothetical protein
MKKLFVIITSIYFLSSCDKGPEPYQNAIELIKKGEYEKSIELLNRVKIEDGKWYDSSLLKKNYVFEKMLEVNDWNIITSVIESESENRKFKLEMKKLILNYAKINIEAGKIDTIINVFRTNENTINRLDTNCAFLLSEMIISNVLIGEWQQKDKSIEIVFNKNGNDYEGKCIKFSNYSCRNKIWYRIEDYKAKLSWNCKSLLSSFTYETSKGFEIVSKDIINVNYKVGNERYTFVRKKNS